MTTNEGTTALIAEAREHWVELNGLNSRAAEVLLQIADALEAATSEQGSAGDIRRAVHLWSERFIPGDRWDTEDARDLDAALKCVVEANPDRSRARVPVQGEPNDDREALSVAIGGVLFNVMNFPAAAQSRLLGQDMRPLRYTLEDAVLEAGFSRTTVSDAASGAERDAALARIAELEAEAFKQRRKFENMAHFSEQHPERAERAEARIAEAAKLHRKYTYYDLEDSCPDTTDEHREEHHHEASDDIGEFYCDQMPTGDVCCEACRDVNGDRMEWPCPTAVSLGLNEGENE